MLMLLQEEKKQVPSQCFCAEKKILKLVFRGPSIISRIFLFVGGRVGVLETSHREKRGRSVQDMFSLILILTGSEAHAVSYR